MMRRRTTSALAMMVYASVAVAISIAAVACTHDFDAYQTGEDDASSDTGTILGKDGAAGADGSVIVPPTDGGSTGDTGAGCAQAAACGTTEKTCTAACDATLNTCNQQCGGGGGNNGCKSKCKSDRDKCALDCTNACHTCTGAACVSACN